MSMFKSIKFPLHQNKARVYDADGRYLFWITLAGDVNKLDLLRKKNESWIDFMIRTQPMRDELEAEELLIAQHFVEAINTFEGNTSAISAEDKDASGLKAMFDAVPPLGDLDELAAPKREELLQSRIKALEAQNEWLKSRIAETTLPASKRDHNSREKYLLAVGMPAMEVGT